MDRNMLWGFISVAVGIYSILLALGQVPVKAGSVHTPMWILGLVGMMFVIAGVMLIMRLKSQYNNLLAGLILLLFSVVGFWISFFGSADSISGGIPFIPRETNVGIARTMFGIGAAISLAMSVIAFRMHLKRI